MPLYFLSFASLLSALATALCRPWPAINQLGLLHPGFSSLEPMRSWNRAWMKEFLQGTGWVVPI